MPVTAGSRRESKGFSPALFYNASRFRGEKFPLEIHCHRRATNIATQLRENARPCGKIYARSRYDVAQTRAVPRNCAFGGENGEAEVSLRRNTVAIETRGNFHSTDISATALIVNYLHPDSAFGFPILKDTRKTPFFSLHYDLQVIIELLLSQVSRTTSFTVKI